MLRYLAVAIPLAVLTACGGGGNGSGSSGGIAADIGVDLEEKVLYLGALNDESGPAVAIGRIYAAGPRILAARVNTGGSGLLPEGWTIELVERDHGYNPQRSVQAYNEIRDRVLYLTTSFGTPNTLPLRPLLERDQMVAIPASLSSLMTENQYTPMPAAAIQLGLPSPALTCPHRKADGVGRA